MWTLVEGRTDTGVCRDPHPARWRDFDTYVPRVRHPLPGEGTSPVLVLGPSGVRGRVVTNGPFGGLGSNYFFHPGTVTHRTRTLPSNWSRGSSRRVWTLRFL